MALASTCEQLAARDAELAARNAELEASSKRIAQLGGVTRYLARVVVERDRELKGLRMELASLHSLPDELDALRMRDEEGAMALERLQRQVAEIGAQARGRTTRIRMQALRHSVQLAAREEAEIAGRAEGKEVVAGK